LVAALATPQDPPPILAPPEGAAFPAGSAVRFIGRGDGPLKLDGQPVETKSPHPGVQTAELKPPAGEHTIQFGGQTLKLFVGAGAPADTKAFRPHPPANQCETCHAVRNGNWRFVRASLSGVCSACHAKEAFPAKHTHEMAVLADCQLCHNPHGSTAAAHLKLSKDAACKQCHSLQ
jgi:predicted CXXCH cytochrome family protein